MRLTELETRQLLLNATKDINISMADRLYPGSLERLRAQAERIIELIDQVELYQYRAGNNPRRDSSND